jgi:hypothetical protein
MPALILLVIITAHGAIGTVFGRATSDLDSTAIAGAIVTLWEQNASDSALADWLGFYSLKLTPGRHTLKATHQDYVPATRALTVVSGMQVRVDFQIHPQAIEMPGVRVEDKRESWYVNRHNDSVLRILRGLRCVNTKPWLAGRTLIPDTAAIRFNNEAMTAAAGAFRRRAGGLFRRPSSYCLHGDNNYVVINHGRCRLINIPEYPNRRARLSNIDSLRLSVDSLGLDAMPAGTQLQYVPMQLEALVHNERWTPIVIQHLVFKL